MKKHQTLKKPLLAAIVLLLLFTACFEFDWLVQPECVNPDSSFSVEVSIITTNGNGYPYTPYFGIRLPQGWNVQDSIEFRHYEQWFYPWFIAGEGKFIYSDSLSKVMDSIDPACDGYYWWVGQGIDTVPYITDYLFRITPVIATDEQTGTFSLDYMTGSNAEGNGGINWARYDSVAIAVAAPDTIAVTSASNAGPGSLREAIETAGCGAYIHFEIPSTDTILLTEPLVIGGDLHITGPEDGPVTLSGQCVSQIFRVSKYCNPVIKNMNLINGRGNNGGAIHLDTLAKPTLENVSIRNSKALLNGGAIYCETESHLTLRNSRITENFADQGGGIFWNGGSTATMDEENRSSIYLNMARQGNDLYNLNIFWPPCNVILDTFSLLVPNNQQASPLGCFVFDILNGKAQTVNADLYVSPEGKNTNSGLSPAEPLKNIDLALSLFYHDISNPKCIRLMEGLYSYSQTNDLFPIVLTNYENLSGITKEQVILDAEGAVAIKPGQSCRLSNFTVTGGSIGIFIWDSSPEIEHVIIKNCTGSGVIGNNTSAKFRNVWAQNNTAEEFGGAFQFTASAPTLINVLATGNQATKGGAVSCSSTQLKLINSTLADNTSGYTNGGAGIYATDGSDISITNSILFNNFQHEVALQGIYNPSQLEIAFSTVREGIEGIYVNGSSTVSWLEGNSDLDPLFDESSIPPYQLGAGSPCIDAGTPDTTGLSLPCWDLLDNKRCWDGDGDGIPVVDMGAYEFGALAVGLATAVQGLTFEVQGYPNPTYGVYNIGITLDQPQHVSWKVYDVTGMLVAEAAEQILPAGEHELQWDAAGLEEGIYFCRVQVGDETVVNKLVKAGGH